MIQRFFGIWVLLISISLMAGYKGKRTTEMSFGNEIRSNIASWNVHSKNGRTSVERILNPNDELLSLLDATPSLNEVDLLCEAMGDVQLIQHFEKAGRRTPKPIEEHIQNAADTMQQLIEQYGCSVHINNGAPLQLAVVLNYLPCVKVLLAHGALHNQSSISWVHGSEESKNASKIMQEIYQEYNRDLKPKVRNYVVYWPHIYHRNLRAIVGKYVPSKQDDVADLIGDYAGPLTYEHRY